MEETKIEQTIELSDDEIVLQLSKILETLKKRKMPETPKVPAQELKKEEVKTETKVENKELTELQNKVKELEAKMSEPKSKTLSVADTVSQERYSPESFIGFLKKNMEK